VEVHFARLIGGVALSQAVMTSAFVRLRRTRLLMGVAARAHISV